MNQACTYEDAIDLLDGDHKAVKKMFIEYDALCEDEAPADERRTLAERICQALTIHAQIEEEIFYPQVRKAISDDALMDEALNEHTEAKETIALIQGMDPTSMDYDVTVNALGKLIDAHVLQEREQIFLRARYAALDLRTLAVALFQRKKQLQGATSAAAKETK